MSNASLMDLAEDGFDVLKDLLPSHYAGYLLTISVEKEESGEEVNTTVLISEVGVEIFVLGVEVEGHGCCILPKSESGDLLFNQPTGRAPLFGEEEEVKSL